MAMSKRRSSFIDSDTDSLDENRSSESESSEIEQRKSPSPQRHKRKRTAPKRLEEFAHGASYPETTDSTGNDLGLPKNTASLFAGIAEIGKSMKTIDAGRSIGDISTNGNIGGCSHSDTTPGSDGFHGKQDKGDNSGNKIVITSDVHFSSGGRRLIGAGANALSASSGYGIGRILSQGRGRGRGRAIRIQSNSDSVRHVSSGHNVVRSGDMPVVGGVGRSGLYVDKRDNINSDNSRITDTAVLAVGDKSSDPDGIFDLPDSASVRGADDENASVVPVDDGFGGSDGRGGFTDSTPLQRGVKKIDLIPRRLNEFSDDGKNTAVMTVLREIRRGICDMNKRLNSRLDVIEERVAAIGSRVNEMLASDFPTKPFCLPLKTREDMELFEQISDADFNQAVDFLGALSSGSITERANLILKAAMDDNLAISYSMQGKKSEPKILGTRFSAALYAAVSKNLLPELRPTQDVYTRAMTASLKAAKERFRRLPR